VPYDRVWFQAEYLYWWLKNGGQSPVVLGTIPTNLANAANLPAGSISAIPGTPTEFDYGKQSGVRLTAGGYLDDARVWGIEGSGFELQKGTRNFAMSSGGDPVIGPVFQDPFAHRETIITYSVPNARSAFLSESIGNSLWGVEANVLYQLPALLFADRLDLMVGFRHLQFGESLDVSGIHTAQPGFADPVAAITSYSDHFGVFDKFYGAQVGLHSHADIGMFTVDVTGKLAMGGMQEVVKINGTTTLVDPAGAIGTTVTHLGGVLAQPTNIGRFNHGDFAVIPELIVQAGWRITSHVQLTVGYNFLYINNLFRVNSQIDGVDGRQVFGSTGFVANPQPVPTRPAPPGAETGQTFWAQGLNAGVEFSY
jgi:hypothetical protein